MPDAPILGGSKKVNLDDEVFGVPFNGPLVHEVVLAELAARRRGTAASKTRGLVSGGGAVFGPSPRQYTVKVNRKARRAALRCALSVHAERSSLFALDVAGFDAPSTKQASDLVADRRGGSVLVIVDADELVAGKSFRNLAGVNVLAAEDAGVADIVGAATVVASQAAIDNLTERARKLERRAVATGEGA
jgi:large subunit ribosomal protein L4